MSTISWLNRIYVLHDVYIIYISIDLSNLIYSNLIYLSIYLSNLSIYLYLSISISIYIYRYIYIDISLELALVVCNPRCIKMAHVALTFRILNQFDVQRHQNNVFSKYKVVPPQL